MYHLRRRTGYADSDEQYRYGDHELSQAYRGSIHAFN